jgi:hypothetical protein
MGKINHMIRRPRVLPDVRDRHPDQDHLQKMVFFYLWEKHFTSTMGKINHMIRRPRVLPDVRDRHPDQGHLQKMVFFIYEKNTLRPPWEKSTT